MPSPLAIVTDSTSDIPPEMAEERQIHVVPLHIMWGQETLRDGVDISRQEFYERLVVEPELPTTSQPAPGEFADVLQRARDATNAEAVITVTLSSALSGTYSSAEQAARMVDFPVTLIDSRTASGALGLHVLAIADLRDRNESVAAITQAASGFVTRTRAALTVDTLEYLHRSGRVSGARRWIGSALQIKPILHVVEGSIVPLATARGRQRSLRRMMELFTGWIDPAKPLYVTILHGNSIEDANAYEAELVERFQPAFIMKVLASATVGAITGPKAMGLTLLQ